MTLFLWKLPGYRYCLSQRSTNDWLLCSFMSFAPFKKISVPYCQIIREKRRDTKCCCRWWAVCGALHCSGEHRHRKSASTFFQFPELCWCWCCMSVMCYWTNAYEIPLEINLYISKKKIIIIIVRNWGPYKMLLCSPERKNVQTSKWGI